MAFTASTVWEVETGGSDANGGGFDPGVAGFPTDGAATVANTSAPIFTSASYSFVAGDVGAWIYIKSGTNWTPGWYKIASVSGGAATLSAAIGAGVLAAGTPTTVAGCATVASPTAATWGIDYSQQGSAQIAFSDLVILSGSVTKLTSAAHPFTINLIGNIINVTGGTNFVVQRVAIVSLSGVQATCDKSLGTTASTGGTGNLGGAFASPALPGSVMVASNAAWIKSGAYLITSASTNVAGGCFSATLVGIRLEGYGAVRGDLGTRPTLTASGISTFTLINCTGNSSSVNNLILDGASLTASKGIIPGRAYLVQVKNCTNNGFGSTSSTLIQCTVTGCSGATAMLFLLAILCEAYSNTVTGFSPTSSFGAALYCLAYNNSGAGSSGFGSGASNIVYLNCIAYGNGNHGFQVPAGSELINCIAENNTGTGMFDNGGVGVVIVNCAVFNNGTNVNLSGANHMVINLITPSADVFVNAAGGNFALNSAAAGGALLKAAGIPGATPDGLSVGFLDIGAIQSAPLYPAARAFTGAMN